MVDVAMLDVEPDTEVNVGPETISVENVGESLIITKN